MIDLLFGSAPKKKNNNKPLNMCDLPPEGVERAQPEAERE